MVVTSALIRQTALRQLAHLAVGPRASTLVVELGYLLIRTPDEGGQVSQVGACFSDIPLRYGSPQPPTGRGLAALLR